MILAKIPLALGCSAILQQSIHALRVLHPDGDGKLIAFDRAAVPVAPKDQFLLIVEERDVLPVLGGGTEADPDDHDSCEQCRVGEAFEIAECGMRRSANIELEL